MSLQGFDGFDLYGSVANLLGRTGYLQFSNATGGKLYSPGRGGGGQCVWVSSSTWAQASPDTTTTFNVNAEFIATFGANLNKGTFGFAMLLPPAPFDAGTGLIVRNQNRFYLDVLDGTGGTNNVQFRLLFDQTTASITVQNAAGTMIGSAVNNAFPVNTWCTVEVQPTIGASGTLEVRINGVAVIAASGLALQATSNAYFNAAMINVPVGTGTTGYYGVFIDDYYIADMTADAGLYANDSFIGGPAVATLYPIGAGSLTQWTAASPTAPIISQNGASTTVATDIVPSSYVYVPGQTVFLRQACAHTGVIAALQCLMLSGFTGHLQMALYADMGGKPIGTPLCVSAIMANPAAGTVSAAVTAGPEIEAGTILWIAIAADAGCTFSTIAWAYGNAPYTPTDGGALQGAPFSAPFPTAASAIFPPPARGYPWSGIELTVSHNWEEVSELLSDGDATFNSATGSGMEDLFVFTTPGLVIESVVAVSVTTAARADAGTPAMTHQLFIGGADHAGAPFNLGAGYTFNTTVFTHNPATASNWTLPDITGMQIGYRLA